MDDIEFILAVLVDLVGKPCAKLIPVDVIEDLQASGVRFAGYGAGAFGRKLSDPDIVAVPDPTSYAPLPFVRPGLAIVHCDAHVDGKPWPFAPRAILARQLQRVRDSGGVDLDVGAEVEYYLVDRGGDGRLRLADRHDTSFKPCYDARDLTRMYEHITAVSRAMNTLGWGNYANLHEEANGQFEQNFAYSDALTTADRVITFRYLLSALAEQRGMTATFMPKPFTNHAGSGLHMHMSLRQGDIPIFPRPGDERDLGLSEQAYAFIGGILEHACALQAIMAPTVNSYKRIGSTFTRSGAIWSLRVATYGGDDRTHFIRVPDGNRIELRSGDSAANPYLAIAAILAAGFDGVERELDPGVPGWDGDGSRPYLPGTLLHAIEAMAADRVVMGALDILGQGVSNYYVNLKRDEFFNWHGQVTQWEVDRYVTAF
jgi:glutamine synthetase